MVRVPIDEYLPFHCDHCNEDGYYRGADPARPVFLVCKGCGEAASFVSCPRCGLGGPFVENAAGHPATWTCPQCHTIHNLPDGFNRERVEMCPERLLPDELRRVLNRHASKPRLAARILMIANLIFVGSFLIGLVIWLIYTLFHNGSGM